MNVLRQISFFIAVMGVAMVSPVVADDPVAEEPDGISAPRPAIAREYVIAEVDGVFGMVGTVQSGYQDTLLDIGRRYNLGYEEIRGANPTVDIWLPGDETEVTLPTQYVLPRAARNGLVINIAEYRMYYFTRKNDQVVVATFPISIGRMDWATPLGRSSIVKKVTKPAWFPPESIREEWAADGRELASRVPPGPDNPLGDYALRLSIPGYLIHGTNRPAGVGMRVTHGCIRMFPEDIEWLFPQIPLDTPVRLVNQPFKMGWSGADLFLEVHAPLEEAEPGQAPTLTAITELYVQVTRDRPAEVNWKLVDEVFRARLGTPVKIGREAVAPGQADEAETASVAAE